MPDFSLVIRPQSPSLPCEGPAPLTLTITYHGQDKTTLPVGDFIEIRFAPPPGWVLRQFAEEAPNTRVLVGFLPQVDLNPEGSWSRQLYLHDYFSTLKPGSVQLTAWVKIWPGANIEPTQLSAACNLTILAPDQAHFTARIQAIERQIAAEKSGEKRQELYWSLASLSHPSLRRIFQAALADPDMVAFHAAARLRLAEMDEKDGGHD